MTEDEELEMLLDEIPHATSLNLHYIRQQHSHHVHVHGAHGHGSTDEKTIHGVCGDDLSCYHNSMCVSHPSGISLHSEGSSSSSLSGGLSSSDDGSATPPEIKSQAPQEDVHYPNRLCLESKLPDSTAGRNSGDSLMDELGLADYLRRMRINGADKDSSIETFKVETPHRLHFGDHSPIRTKHSPLGMNGSSEDYRKEILNYRGLQCSARSGPRSFDEETRSALFRLQREAEMGSLSGSNLPPGGHEGLYSGPLHCSELLNFPRRQVEQDASNEASCNFLQQADSALGMNPYDRGTQLLNVAPSVNKLFPTDAFLCSQRNGVDSSRNRLRLNSRSHSQLTDPKMPLDAEILSSYSLPIFSEMAAALPNGWATRYLPSVRSSPNIEAFNFEDSLIIEGKGLHYVTNKGAGRSRGHKRIYCNDISTRQPREKNSDSDSQSHFGEIPAFKCENGRNSRIYCPSVQPPRFNSLMEVQGYIYFIAKDQHGCRFLQQKFDEGTAEDVEMIFNEIIKHVVELMINPFGNYLIQKLLDVCTEEQRMQILLMVTEEPGQLIKISLDTHGTRVAQKLIETLKTKQQILMFILALEPGFLVLINDLNGNHVIQHCLQCLSSEDNKFIFKAAAKYCVNIATHRHGCCVLQRCIAHSTGEHREKLVAKISTHGFLLAQDAFGNYVVQFIIELKIPTATANLISQFEGNYVHLSTQKFSSNVVEKCLKVFGDENKSRIVHELLSYSHFEQLLQDPFANYVIQSALGVTKGHLHASLVEAIRPNAAILRTSPYCKRIFSRTILKK
ncbi:pumilio domain-containing protein C4G8.03c-like [Macadamia integrifolia]|uniref:pumilio domain-containing protein C4G8.03c-like n=1 Tax=Macadamia integrifolia TaxID=60698 RepID=UPI001C5007DC|nr:pumilio domain-containing protein C4G8.03c-like [Macadamia integrifolia]XP_042486454.1 pumilio domain-containing protein C4G8.03c-like [Macadamia integrifolia]